MSLISRSISLICVLFLSLTSILIFPTPTLALGITDNHLAPCPSSPNCVVSQNGDEKHAIESIPYHVDREKAKETLLKVLTAVPRTEVVEETDNYIHALSKSRIFKFIDDVEFYFPSDENVIHVRSASRVGESDLGVNRTRMQQIRLAMQDLNV
ncbi:hypothetical protein NIES267_08350 [Calothrix parasitica NIES-267]|uniref:DUF1499 domain-containing protein n=1 Tax=Calothrix parasitica NIES-267 TaxID=1973488 RepID=A0A1Z4LJJ9_9CYAN|nr:hypothetical protein NIES267_08350 [Calothrix parasitica NIES-267]